MTGLIFILAIFFGSITLWSGMHLVRFYRRPAPLPRPRILAPSPTDPRGALMMRQREREGMRPANRAL